MKIIDIDWRGGEIMLATSFIIAFMVYFLKATTWRGMIFNKIKEKFIHWPQFIKLPLFDCPVCMTPWWGTLIYIIAYLSGIPEFKELSLVRVIFTVFTASGINAVIINFTRILEKLIRPY